EANEVVVEVQDSGRWRRHRVDGGGRGLKIMRSLVDRVHIATTTEGTTIRLSVSHPVQRSGGVP
ncbi:MAG: ATP-binding protein, partial [Armatimonadota bacterium]